MALLRSTIVESNHFIIMSCTLVNKQSSARGYLLSRQFVRDTTLALSYHGMLLSSCSMNSYLQRIEYLLIKMILRCRFMSPRSVGSTRSTVAWSASNGTSLHCRVAAVSRPIQRTVLRPLVRVSLHFGVSVRHRPLWTSPDVSSSWTKVNGVLAKTFH